MCSRRSSKALMAWSSMSPSAKAAVDRVEPARTPAYRLGPMNSSSLATEARRATEIESRFMTRHCTPSASHASQKMRLDVLRAVRELVADVLVGPLRVLDAIDVARAIGVDEPAHELIGVGVDDPLLPRREPMGRSCLRPGPCCGKRHGQCFQYDATSSMLRDVDAGWSVARRPLTSSMRERDPPGDVEVQQVARRCVSR